MFASTLPKNTMTQIRQVALVRRYSPLSLSLLLKLFKCTSRVLHDTDTCIPFAGSGREEWGEKKRKGSLGIKVCAFLSLIAKDFLDLFYLLFRVKNVEHFRFAKGYIELIFSILY